jgi:hypothetical protein
VLDADVIQPASILKAIDATVYRPERIDVILALEGCNPDFRP